MSLETRQGPKTYAPLHKPKYFDTTMRCGTTFHEVMVSGTSKLTTMYVGSSITKQGPIERQILLITETAIASTVVRVTVVCYFTALYLYA